VTSWPVGWKNDVLIGSERDTDAPLEMKYTFSQLHAADRQRCHTDRYSSRLLKCFRRCQTSEGLPLLYYRWRFKRLKEKRHLEIYGKCDIGPGLYLGHVFGITINADVVIGSNCNIHKGVTIGQENRGARKGSPVIGNSVWIGVNATVVGGITIGDDVLIAPNSFVNRDVPSHSIVYGNPCVIEHREGATDGYVNHKCHLQS
jgi:serine O-acetyltransferase